MSEPTRDDITIYRGDGYHRTYLVTNSAGVATDLSSFTVQSELREARLQAATLITSFTMITSDSANGRISATLTNSVTSIITNFRGYHDIVITPPSGLPERLVLGEVVISPTVTKA